MPLVFSRADGTHISRIEESAGLVAVLECEIAAGRTRCQLRGTMLGRAYPPTWTPQDALVSCAEMLALVRVDRIERGRVTP